MGLTGPGDKLYKNLVPGLWHNWLTDTWHLTLESEFCSGSWKGSHQKLTAFQNYSTLTQTITLHIHSQYYIKTITMAIPQWDQRWTANTISTDGSSFHLSIKSNLHLLWFCLNTLEAIGIKILRYSLNQSEVKPNPIITCSQVFLYFTPATSLGLEFWLVHCIVHVHYTSLTLVISLVLILQLSSDSHSY